MKVMLCIPTFLLFQDEERVGAETVLARQTHLAAFRVLCRMLDKRDHDVYCALKLYAWRLEKVASGRVAVKRDWAEVQEAQHVIGCPMVNRDSSRGVHVEMGWATALRKPVSLLLHRPWTRHTVLVTGLRPQGDFDVRNFYYVDDPSEVFPSLVEHIEGDEQ